MDFESSGVIFDPPNFPHPVVLNFIWTSSPTL